MRPTHVQENGDAVRRRQHLICDLLEQGVNAAQVARQVGISRKRIYDIANRFELPTNPTCRPGSKLERQIMQAYHVCTLEELEKIYRISQRRLKEIIDRVLDEETDRCRNALQTT
jgi:transposase